MLVAPTASTASGRGPRPLNLARDVPQVLALLDLVFRPSLDAAGRRALGASLSLTHAPGFVWRLSQLASGMAPGFVWETQGRIVGNVSILKTGTPLRFLVANVAVHPDYRRQGIARQLMILALKAIRNRGGHAVLLQVKEINVPARQLYASLGFVELGHVATWQARYGQVRELPVPASSSPIRPLRRGEWRQAYAVDVAGAHPELTWPDPLAPDVYKAGWWRAARRFLNGQQAEIWVVEGPDRQLRGLGVIQSDFGRPYELRLRVAPAAQGELERPLLAKLLRRLGYLRRRHIQIAHPDSDETTARLLAEAGFQVRSSLTTMKLTL